MNPDAPVMFIGRFSPWHKGHQTLVETKLKQGKAIVIAIRDTPISDKNPFTYTERYEMITEALSRWKDMVQVIKIPDICGVAYGRDVGWTVEHIELPKDIEAISATKIRESMK